MYPRFPTVILCALALALLLPKICMGQPQISEFLASNATTGEDEDGQASDWIEVHNPDDVPVDLAGHYLTDDPDNLTKWKFPSGFSRVKPI